MSLSDPIGDMIARVKNAQARNHKKVELPSSNFKSKIADILKNEGFIKNAPKKVVENEEKKMKDTEARIEILKNKISSLSKNQTNSPANA